MIMIKSATKGTVTDDGALLIETEAYKKVRAELTLHHVFGAVALPFRGMGHAIALKKALVPCFATRFD